MTRALSYVAVLGAVVFMLSRPPRVASAEEDPPEPKDCWEQIWSDQTERDVKKKVVTDAIALMQVKADDPNTPQARSKWLAATCKALAKMWKNGQICPACIVEDGLSFPLAKPPMIYLKKESLCAPEDPEDYDSTANVPITMAHEYGHILDSGPMMTQYCIPYAKYCDALQGKTGPGIPAKPAAGSQAEKEMKVMCYLYSVASGLDEIGMRVLEMMNGPYLDQPDPGMVEYFACHFWGIACVNLDAAKEALGQLQGGQPAVSGFDKAKAETQVKELEALKEQIANEVAAARAQHPDLYDDEWPYEEEPEVTQGEDD